MSSLDTNKTQSSFLSSFDESTLDIYYIHRSSVMRALVEICEELKSKNISKNIKFEDLDNHAELFNLSQTDLLAIKMFSATEQSGTLYFTFYVACSTLADDNGIRLSKIVSHAFSRFASNRRIAVFGVDGEQCATMTCETGTEVMPMSKSDNRMVQYIDVTVSTDLSM